MPPYPITDAHVHLWNPELLRISWLDTSEVLGKPFEPAEYSQHTEGLPIEGFVYVEVDVDPSYRLLEAKQVAKYAEQYPRIKAVVVSAPLEDGRVVRSLLAELVAANPLVKGVRRLLQGESDPEFCLRPGFIEGVKQLADFKLSFDICIKHYQLAGAIELVRRCPEVSFVLDHIAKPDIKAQLLDPWREQMRELAALPNVYCKMSGLVTEADSENWTAEDLKPYVRHVLEVFGEDRVMYGSDWPVVLNASSYKRWYETLLELTDDLSDEAKRKLWSENTRRFYRIA